MMYTFSSKSSWNPCRHRISGCRQKCIRSSIMCKNMWAIPELHSGLLLSRRWSVSINFSPANSKWIVQNPSSFENLYLTLYYIITCDICKQRTDVLYIIFPSLTASDSWAWKNRQEVFQNANYSALLALRRTTCPVHTNYHPRFFWENVDEIVVRYARQYSANIVVSKKHYFVENFG